MQRIFSFLLGCYFGAGLFGGYLIQKVIPALNPFGVFTYATTWPHFIYCAPVARNCRDLSEIVPLWYQSLMFTF